MLAGLCHVQTAQVRLCTFIAGGQHVVGSETRYRESVAAMTSTWFALRGPASIVNAEE